MNGIRNGVVYDWASVLADRMEEFMTLQHKNIYMPYHAIGLFLDAMRVQISPETQHLAPHNRVHPRQLPIFYWVHSDITTPSGDTQSGKKQKRRVVVSEYEPESESKPSGEEASVEEDSVDTSQARDGSFRMVSRGGHQVEEETSPTVA